MKLYYSPTSPFARKVRMTSMALGLEKEIELVLADVYDPGSDYPRVNPLNKIPALQLRDGRTLVNSPFICDYLNTLSLGVKVIPSGPEKWDILQTQAISDGIMEAAVLRRYEILRPADKFDKKFDARQKDKIEKSLAYLEKNLAQLLSDQDLGVIATLCAMGYLDFRFSHEKWSEKFPRLNDWYQSQQQWKPFAQTRPQ